MATFALKDIAQHIEAQLQKTPAESGLTELRQLAFDELKSQGLPTIKTEDWKYTNLRKLAAESFNTATPQSAAEIPRSETKHRLVLVNGYFRRELSDLSELPHGIRIHLLEDLNHPQLPSPSLLPGWIADLKGHPFAAINSASFTDALLIDVDADAQIDKALELLWLGTGTEPAMANPRLLLNLGKGARLTLLEQHLGSQTSHLINKVSELNLEDAAQLTHVQLQNTEAARLINGTHVRCHRGTVYQSQNYDLGGAFIRNDLMVSLEAPGGDVQLDGMFTTSNKQHVDNHIRVDHHAGNCNSRVLYKGLLGDGGQGVFNGKLVVHPDALQTDARQVNHNLLLSTDVEINTKPELEIYADDVKCSHGCTTGALDPDQLFYLLSRGIGRSDAHGLLVDAFAGEILDRLQAEQLIPVIKDALNLSLKRLVNNQERTQ